MSRTTVKAIWPGERAEDLRELRNSWGSAPYVWSAICGRYLGSEGAWLSRPRDVWPLANDPTLPEHHRAVLAITYDRAYIRAEHYGRAAVDIRRFLADFPPPVGDDNHWREIADILESAACPAIGFHMTSVSADLWAGEWDDESEDRGPIDWGRAWSVYDHLDPAPAEG